MKRRTEFEDEPAVDAGTAGNPEAVLLDTPDYHVEDGPFKSSDIPVRAVQRMSVIEDVITLFSWDRVRAQASTEGALMRIDDEKITSLREKVNAAHQEFDMAVTFHEVWKPAAFDEELHKQMGKSYAANAFFVVRTALRREMLLALMRLWDNPKDSRPVAMESIAKTLGDEDIIAALAADRAARIMPEAEDQMRTELGRRADAAITLIGKYSKGGSHDAVLRKLRQLRNKRLAHRQTAATAATKADPTAGEIESFYQDMSQLIRLLLSLVIGLAYDPEDTGHVYRHHATFFWASVRRERTEGHPNYR